MRIASVIPVSEVNGPGPHYTIWVQGCTLSCPECFNSNTHDKNLGREKKISHLLKDIRKYFLEKKIIGVTLSGGEPLQQINEVIELTSQIKAQTDLGIIILTGYNVKELQQLPDFNSVTQNADLIIAGRFRENLKIQTGLRGSSNKNYLYISEFYKKFDLNKIPIMEVIANELGEIIVSGIDPEPILDAIKPTPNME
ncbi:MAG: 4Fe-4S single cluster domain-containing protein [Candidatus Hodarchaeales archaeon]